jgi:hypothetical protein
MDVMESKGLINETPSGQGRLANEEDEDGKVHFHNVDMVTRRHGRLREVVKLSMVESWSW